MFFMLLKSFNKTTKYRHYFFSLYYEYNIVGEYTLCRPFIIVASFMEKLKQNTLFYNNEEINFTIGQPNVSTLSSLLSIKS